MYATRQRVSRKNRLSLRGHIMDDSDWTELDLEPEIPDPTYTLIGKVSVQWSSFENDLQWQCVVEAQADMLENIPDKGVFSGHIETRFKSFARLRRARIGHADGSRLDELQATVLAIAEERARLLHGHIYAENGQLKVRHQPVKSGSAPQHVDIEPTALADLLQRVQAVRQRFGELTATHMPPNAHVD